ncbi:hypothetical protein GCM10009798_16180 [Nocardioides panacihumi]|uniref:DUF4175 domain-containing protein n=1 Tax=Nocardioides panacihumi TaxID=400774 RepID=A0ABN2QSZ3_9ACTN
MPNRPRSPILVMRLVTFVGLMLVFLVVLGGLGVGMAELVVWLIAVVVGSLVILAREPRGPGPS